MDRLNDYGGFSPQQGAVLESYVRGKRVLDLGSGDGVKASYLLDLGSSHVLCVEKEFVRPSEHLANRTFLHTRMEDLPETAFTGADIALLAWPQPYTIPFTPKFHLGLDAVEFLIYQGKNTDGTVCGDPILFRYLCTREVLAYVPHKINTLIVYGPQKVVRDPKPEEMAGLRNREMDVLTYEVIECIM